MLLAGLIFLADILINGSHHQVFQKLFQLHTKSFPFLDLQTTLTGIEMASTGADPLLERTVINGNNWCYPRIWYFFSIMGLTPEMTNVAGIVLIFAFYLTNYFLFRRLKPFEALVTGTFLISPPVILALERGNVDVLIYCILFASVFLIQKKLPLKAIGYAAVLFTAMLKLFPVFAFPVVLGEKRKTMIWTGSLLIAAFLIYLAAEASAIRILYEQMGKPVGVISYGIQQVPSFLHTFFTINRTGSLTVVIIVLFILSLILSQRKPGKRLDNPVSEPDTLSFSVSCLVFLGTYFTGFNFIYRMIFLLPALPFLFRSATPGQPLARLSQITLLIMWFAFFHMMIINPLFQTGPSFLIKEMLLLALFLLLTFLTGKSCLVLPEILTTIRSFRSVKKERFRSPGRE